MTPERQRKLNAILDRAVEIEPGERVAFLDAACSDDLELRSELESILALETEADRFLDQPVQCGLGMLGQSCTCFGHLHKGKHPFVHSCTAT